MPIKVFLSDLDGTLRDKNIPDEVLVGLGKIRQHGIETSVITGRFLRRLHSALGEHATRVLSSSLPVIVENGAKLVDQHGQVLHREHMDATQIAEVIHLVEQGTAEAVAFSDQDPNKVPFCWVRTAEKHANYNQKLGHDYQVFQSDFTTLSHRLRTNYPGTIVLVPDPGLPYVRYTAQTMHVFDNEQSINLTPMGVNKASGVTAFSQITGLQPEEILLAGNEHNDVPMLSLPGHPKIFVGPKLLPGVDEKASLVASPAHLGQYLSSYPW